MVSRNFMGALSGSGKTKTLFALFLLAAGLPGTGAHAEIADSARRQIQEIASLKANLTPAERKLSFNLVLLERDSRHKLPSDLQGLVNHSLLNSTGDASVVVNGYLTPSLLGSDALKNVDKVNGQIPASAFAAGKVRANVSVKKLLSLAEHSDVKFIGGMERHTTNAGSVTSQGYVAHGANKVVPTGVTGSGVNVGVLSDSATATRVSALIASGDLPANTTVLPGQDGSGEDEGTAMMEIVHDIAPGANLFFATAFSGEAQFAANIRALRFTYHCDIIVDDVTYFDEGAFQDGPIAQAVNDITADGGLYFSSAANSGNLSSGTSGTWEGDFTAGPASSFGTLHNFGSSTSPMYADVLTAASQVVTLKWSDPLGGSSNDYDLYILNSAGTQVVAVGGDAQTGTQDPYEEAYLSSGNIPAGDQVVVALYAGAARALHVDTNRGRLQVNTSGSTYGHNAGKSTYTVAAVYWNSAHQGPRAFTGGSTNPVETFSSDGLRKIFYNPDGSPITPGNYLFGTSGGTTLQKPDGAAADGVVTRTPGFNPFYGTSAAAPHAAGIAALVKSANPSLTNTQIRNILNSTALDNMAPGVDRDTGYGILWAPSAVGLAKAGTQ